MANPNQLLNVVQAVSTVVSRLLPVVEHIPDSFGKWIPPIKAAVAAHSKLGAQIGLASGAAKVLRGRFGAVDAVMAGLNLRTVGVSRKMSALGAIGGIAVSKLVRHFHEARREAAGLAQNAGVAEKKLSHIGRSGFGLVKATVGVVGINKLLGLLGSVPGSLAGHLKGAFDLGGTLTDLASKTGLAADQMLILGQAGKDAGIEDVAGGVNKLQDALVSAAVNGASPAAKAFGFLGLQAGELVKQTPVGQLEAIGAALRGIKSPELRTSIARDLFGKSGTDLLPLLDNAKALEEAQASLGRQAGILKENAARFDAVSDRLNRSGLKLQGFFVGLAATVLPLMEAATAKLDAVDLASQGERFGAGVKVAVNFLAGAFADPASLLAPFESSLKAAFLGAGNVLFAVVKAIGPQLGAIFSGLSGVFIALQRVISGSLMQAFAGPIDFLTAAIQQAFEQFKAELAEVRDQLTPGGSAAGNAFRASSDRFFEMRTKRQMKLRTAGEMDDNMIPTTENAKQQMALVNQLAPQSPFAARSLTEIQAANGSIAGPLGGPELAAGQAMLKTELDALFNAAGAVFKNLRIDDVLGAGEEIKKAGEGFAAIRAKGAEIVDKFTGGGAEPGRTPIGNRFGALSKFATFSSPALGGGSLHSGVIGATMAGSLGSRSPGGGSPFDFSKVANLSRPTSGPILSAAERRAFDDAGVRAGGARTGSTAGAFGVVHAGDAARRKELKKDDERERLKGKEGIEKSNHLLGLISGAAQRTANALDPSE